MWRQAATQVFFALGLGYGSVIAYSSYNPVHNNCHRDALMVSTINFMTSVLATLVVFVVLGFRAKTIALGCVAKYERVCMRVCLSVRESEINMFLTLIPHFVLLYFRNLGLLNLTISSDPTQHASATSWPLVSTTDLTAVSIAEYRQWFAQHGSDMAPTITDCSLEEEMNKVKLAL